MAQEEGAPRFRCPKSATEERNLIESAIPTSTKYKNRWALNLFTTWQRERTIKVPVLDCGGLFKDYEWNKVKALDEEIENMDALTLNYWLSKFVMEVCKEKGERYPPRTVYGIVAGIKGHLQEINGPRALNPLDITDKRFCLFRRALDAEMKDGTRAGLHVTCKKDEKEFVSAEEEEQFWQEGLLGTATAKSLLNTVYFYNGKIFGLRGGGHRIINVNNFEVGTNFIRFEENASKTYSGGLNSLKYIPRVVKHVCHAINVPEHERCLVEIYRLYIGLVERIGYQTFYFRPSTRTFGYETSPVGINTLNKSLPGMCESIGVRRKTAHSLRVTCASSLFNAGIDEKMIRQRTGHRSNALFAYEKPSEENIAKVSGILGPNDEFRDNKDVEGGSCATSTASIATASHSKVVIEAGGKFENCTFNLAPPTE